MPNFSCGRQRPPSCGRDSGGELDRVALDRDVDVEAALAEQDVADGSADEVDALVALAGGGDRLEGRLQPAERLELAGDRRVGRLASPVAHRRSTSLRVTTPASLPPRTIAMRPASAPVEQALELGERRVLARGRRRGRS